MPGPSTPQKPQPTSQTPPQSHTLGSWAEEGVQAQGAWAALLPARAPRVLRSLHSLAGTAAFSVQDQHGGLRTAAAQAIVLAESCRGRTGGPARRSPLHGRVVLG